MHTRYILLKGTEGRTDGRTESQKICPSAFLRKGGGQYVDHKKQPIFFSQTKNTLKDMEFSKSGEYLLYDYEL